MQMVGSQFSRNRFAVVCLWIIAGLYAMAFFADILAPYSFKDESRGHSYCPPTAIHLMRGGKLTRPFIYSTTFVFDDFHQRVYKVDETKAYPLKFFSQGNSDRFLGIVPWGMKLFTVEAPARIYLMGADSRGRDIFSRILYGARVSLTIGLLGVCISFGIGLIVGGISGYFGGKVDSVLMRLSEMVMMVPGFYLLLALRAAVPDNLTSLQVYFAVVIILSFIGWAGLARVIRGMCLSLRERDYVLAAKTMGVSDMRIIMTHILPHTVSYSIAAVMLSIPGYILGESALSLIGLGIQDPYASWGNMLSDAMGIVRIGFAPWILWPAVFIFLAIMSFNVVGDALRDALDPMMKSEETA
ncbi:MAG: ABC transporter permease [Candidatus Omnitrophica bacterium]|nr:ABC transporter permease [Candidatus Omnitrophota bacterium]